MADSQPGPSMPTTHARPAQLQVQTRNAANARTHVGGGRTPLPLTPTRTVSFPPGGRPAVTYRHSVPRQTASRQANHPPPPAQPKGRRKNGTGPLIASLSRRGPAPQKQPLWTAWAQPTPRGGRSGRQARGEGRGERNTQLASWTQPTAARPRVPLLSFPALSILPVHRATRARGELPAPPL